MSFLALFDMVSRHYNVEPKRTIPGFVSHRMIVLHLCSGRIFMVPLGVGRVASCLSIPWMEVRLSGASRKVRRG
jgi:hypothetical protein